MMVTGKYGEALVFPPGLDAVLTQLFDGTIDVPFMPDWLPEEKSFAPSRTAEEWAAQPGIRKNN